MAIRDFIASFFTLDLRKVDWGRTILLVLLILAIAAALWQWAMPEVRTITTTQFKKVPDIRTVHDVQRVYVPCPQQGIQVLDKRELAAKLPGLQLEAPSPSRPTGTTGPTGLMEVGDQVQATPGALEVTATGELPESRNGYQQVAVLDMTTGQTDLQAKEKPAPWFQFRNDGAVGIRYGLNQHLMNVGEVYGRWDFLRIRDVYLSANANLETGGDAKLQVGAEYRW